MELSEKVRAALNDQINLELASAYVYLSMSAYCLDQRLKGFAGWMMKQSEEEVGHAMRIFDYLDERSARIELRPVDGPKQTWSSPPPTSTWRCRPTSPRRTWTASPSG